MVRAIVHLMADEPLQPERTDLVTALDVVLNNIIDRELTGVRYDCIRLVVQTNAQMIEYPIGFNALEVRAPSNVVTRSAATADQPIHIRLIDLVGGTVAFHVDQHAGKPASAKISSMLA